MPPARPDHAAPLAIARDRPPFRIRATWTADASGPLFVRWLPAPDGVDRSATRDEAAGA